jgi:hypothetical protein
MPRTGAGMPRTGAGKLAGRPHLTGNVCEQARQRCQPHQFRLAGWAAGQVRLHPRALPGIGGAQHIDAE